MSEEHWAVAIIRTLESERFYGALSLKFRDGALVIIERNETILPPQTKQREKLAEGARA